MDRCPTCGRVYVPPKKLKSALAMVAGGVRPAHAAKVAGISRQLLHHHMGKAK